MGDWVAESLRHNYFKALILLLNRGELSLSSLSMEKVDNK